MVYLIFVCHYFSQGLNLDISFPLHTMKILLKFYLEKIQSDILKSWHLTV